MSGLLKKSDTFNKIKLAFPSIELEMRLLCALKSPFVFPSSISRTVVVGLSLEILTYSPPHSQFYHPKPGVTCGVALVLDCEQDLALTFTLNHDANTCGRITCLFIYGKDINYLVFHRLKEPLWLSVVCV